MNYLDIFEGGKSEFLYITKYDEDCDIGTAYMDRSSMKRQDNLNAEHKVPVTKDCYMNGKLLDGTNWKILLNTGESKSFMSKIFYLSCLPLQSIPKYASKTKNLLVGKG